MGFFSKLFGKSQSVNKTENFDKEEPEIKLVPLDEIFDKNVEYLLETKNVFFKDFEIQEEENKRNIVNDWNDFMLDFFEKNNVYVPLYDIDDKYEFIQEVNNRIDKYNLDKVFEVIKIQLLEKIDKHIKVLAKKFNILVYQDDYGDYQFDNWHKELAYFYSRYSIDSNIFEESKLYELYNTATKKVLEYLEQEDFSEKLIFDENISPTEYEYFCADILKLKGIDARVTKTSGDQGADVIVYDKQNLPLIVIQCKLYSKPVGNKAVQEIYSAKQYYGADRAIVVSNNSFTKSAQHLANSNEVDLLHHDDLYDLAEMLINSNDTNQLDNDSKENYQEIIKSVLEGIVSINYFILINYYNKNDNLILKDYYKKTFISLLTSNSDVNEPVELIINSNLYKDLELFFKAEIFHNIVIIYFAQILESIYDEINEENTRSKIHKLIKSEILNDFENLNVLKDIDEKINVSLNIIFSDERSIINAVVKYIHFNIYTKNLELFSDVKNYSELEWKNILISKSKEILKNEFSYLDFIVNKADENILIINFSYWHNYLTSEEKSILAITEDDLQ